MMGSLWGTSYVPFRLVLIDDHPLLREGLRRVLSAQPDLEVVGEAASAREGYAVVDAVRPDVALVDLALPGTDGVAATRELRRRQPRCRVLILSMHVDEALAVQALSAGANGYATKDQPADAVIEAVHMVGRGETYLSPRLSREAILDHLRPRRHAPPAADPLAELSAREREIFGLAVRGFSNEGIAGELVISVKTVETHRAHINKKLGVHSTAELVRFAARHGLLPEPD
jgi:two-component system response regulator NreC